MIKEEETELDGLETIPVKVELLDPFKQEHHYVPAQSKEMKKLEQEFLMCDQCEYSTKDRSNLKKHKRVRHEKRVYKCLHCDVTTSFKQYLQKHMKEKHNSHTIYFCSHCDYTSEDKEAYDEHKSKHNSHIKNDRKYRKPTTSKTHEENTENVDSLLKPFLCEHCNYLTDRKTNLNTHIKAVHADSLDVFCEACSFATTTKEYLNRHIQKKHTELDNSRPYPLFTPEIELPEHKFFTNCRLPKLYIEGFVLIMNKYFFNHQGEKMGYFYCSTKNKNKCKVSGKARVVKPKNVEAMGGANNTDCVGENQAVFVKEEISIKEEVIVNQEVNPLEDEEVTLKLISYQGKHTNNCSQISPEEFELKEAEKERWREKINRICDLCEHVSTSNKDFHLHRGEAHGLKDYCCDKCDFKTHHFNTLKIHTRDEHKGRKHPCSYCNHISTNRSHLKTHIESKHEGVSYQCDKCGKKFKQSYMLKIHIDTEHNGIVKRCPHCTYVSKQTGHLNHHIKTVHLGHVHKCDICQREFMHGHNVKEHKMRAHNIGTKKIPSRRKKPSKSRKNNEEQTENNESLVSKTGDDNTMEENGFIVETKFSLEINKRIP